MNKESISPRTARDALIIELLGDVGSIHDEIKELPNVLKASLSESLKIIATAVEDAEKTAEKLKEETKTALASLSRSELNQAQEKIGDLVKSSVDEAVKKSLSGAQAEIQMLEESVHSVTVSTRKHNPAIMNYVLAMVMTVMIVTMLFSTIYLWGEVQEARNVARHTERTLDMAGSAMDKLPEKYKQQIRDEIEKIRSK
ncbi:hypothetical protein SK355_13910 [Candidatus Fukatsuia symbiotica]|uniref:Uncharacterized protein n=1 Tax=Candidatus Fukatsuia symbiotica TaxID=1878942 RepID=A0A2Y9CKJ0_9GAMM|nr:hypothetical protein [Candidatus Fukatsuia symbiotica]AWK15600.1 hypothetical protein CCS41_14360 [Candidatus Fukatsuia symbiotica]MEA9446243.1 hypothetical protein [Candidatus Fukatsuia symbiotica]